MKICLFFILLLSNIVFAQQKYIIPADKLTLDESRAVLYFYEGRKINENKDRKDVLRMLKSVGIKQFMSWCAAFQYYCFYVTGYDAPIRCTGVANDVFADAKKRGKLSKYVANVDDLIVWYIQGSWKGHIGRVVEVQNAGWVMTIEGNTSNSDGSVREGDGVYKKRRNIYHPLYRLRVKGLIGFETQ